MAKKIDIGGELHSVATDHKVADASEIKDISKGNKSQTAFNNDVDRHEVEIHGTGGINNRLDDLEAMEQIVIDGGEAQIAQGSDFTNPDATKRAKIPTVGAIVDGLNDGVYDVSKRNPTAGPNSDGKFTLDYILSNADTLIPTGWRHGGMTISFVQSSDNKYVQFRCMAQNFTTDATQWQGIDDVPTAGSENLVKSGGVANALEKVSEISKEAVIDEDEEIIIEDNDNNEVFKVTKDFVNAKNLKRNGQDVLTQQDISGKADIPYVNEELAKKQDKVDGLSSETTIDTAESLEFSSNDLSETYAKIDKDGVHTKGVSLFPKTPSGTKDISGEQLLEFGDEIVFTDNNNVPSVAINKDGVKTRSLMDINGNPISFGENSVCYISPNGNDTNSGVDTSHPMRTFNAAFAKGFNSIILLAGVYDQTINTTQLNSSNVEIKGARGERVIFKKSNALISNSGEETIVDGYTKVYKLDNVANIDYGNANNRAEWLFFDEKVDVTTAISESDAHPLERGMFYRCDCTKSIRTTATTLQEALAEIEALGENQYKWFYDNGALYFNRPDSTSVYPLYKSVGSYFTTRDNQSIVLSNIEFRYGIVNLDSLNIVKVYNCAAKYIYGSGAFTYNNSLSVEFNKCEAACSFSGVNGDGFNAHASNTTVDYRTKRNQVLYIDCWSHDNNDDGYSDHEFGETTIIGGLFEYNKKAGITPSYGSHCTCYNVYSRHNYAGFAYVGDVNDRGNNGQCICYNCISEQNDRGGNRAGFVVTQNNRMQLINCLAINETTGYSCAIGCYMDLYDCKTLNCTTQKSAGGTLNVYNSISVL